MKPIRRHAKYVAALVWLCFLGALFAWARSRGMGTVEVVDLVYGTLVEHPLAPLIYILVYTARSLTFFPAMWLTLAAGGLFGFLPGVIYALIGENLSAIAAYWIARFFGTPERDGADTSRRLNTSRQLLREQAFPTVIVLRATYLPFDLVNYACGLLRVPWWPYFFGSLIGLLPPMITFVSFGATVDFEAFLANIDDFGAVNLINREQLLISGGLLVLSAIIAWYAHRHHWGAKRRTESKD